MKLGPALLLLLALPAPVHSQEIVKQVGHVAITVAPTHAFPGGVMIVRLQSRRPIETAFANFQGRRSPVFSSAHGLRALVPIPVDTAPGPATLGIELMGRRRRQRIALQVTVGRKDYPPQTVVVPDDKRLLLRLPSAIRDGRLLLSVLRTVTPTSVWFGPFRAPVVGPPRPSFGGLRSYVGGSPVERTMDGTYGEYHRGLDYDVPAGTVVQAPAAGTVLLAGALTLSGQTLVLDHGLGVISVFFHLGRIDVREGERVEGRAPIALSGDSGLAVAPHVHWGTYILGVAVDPTVLERIVDE